MSYEFYAFNLNIETINKLRGISCEKKTNLELQTLNHELQTTNYKPRTTNHEL